MNKIRVVGIDIAKSIFQVCVWIADGSVAWNKKISRQKFLDTLRQFEPGTLLRWKPVQPLITGGELSAQWAIV